ncbi:MAG: zf-HC2 domain-containing protein [Planctomycetota bacterium]|nr:zf-HC2 domain-containing protein [Planctomycetota bacterium]
MTTSTVSACARIQAGLRDFLEGQMSAGERNFVAAHLQECPACKEACDRRNRLVGLMNQTLGQMNIGDDFAERATTRLRDLDEKLNEIRRSTGSTQLPDPEAVTVAMVPFPWQEGEAGGEAEEERLAGAAGGMLAKLGGAPWWMLSGAFHALLIILITLIGAAIMRHNEKDVVFVTNLEKRPEVQQEEKEQKRDIFKNIQSLETTEMVTETPAVVTHDEMEVADHLETANESEAAEAAGENGIADVMLGGSGTSAALGMGGGGGGAYGRPSGAGGRLRRAVAGGGGKATESAVDRGLEWLARNQEAGGHWDAQRHGGKHTGPTGDVAMTGYALLAFLGAGHTEKVGKYKENVRRAVKYLIEMQGKNRAGHDGRWVPLNYTNGIATMALSEAAGMGRIPDTIKAAQKAVDAVNEAQITRGNQSDREAWDYSPKGGTNDSSIMAWNIMAMKSAKIAGLHVDPVVFTGCLTWIDAGQDLGNLKPGEAAPSEWEGGKMSYRGTVAVPNKGAGSMAVTAAAALCRLHIGGAGLDDPGVLGPCNLIKKSLPKKYPYNLYYGYYATLVMFQKGGEHWKAWNEAMKPALLDTQRKGGPEDGSWDPAAGSGSDDDRVMSTALAILSLEVYYRYLPLYRDK